MWFSLILSSASCRVDFSLMVINGVLMMSLSMVASAYTVASLTLLSMSSSVTIPIGMPCLSVTTMSSLS